MKKLGLEQINKVDKQDMLSIIDSQPDQLRQNYADSMSANIVAEDGRGLENIVFVGMGGSALAGDITRDWLSNRLLLPFEVVRSSQLPGYVDEHTLVIVSSYSGNTSETLAAFSQAIKNNCQVMALGGGGKLQKLCQTKNINFLQLPKVSQPRLAVFAALKALACVLEDMQTVIGDLRRELQDSADFLDTQKLAWAAEADDNKAKNLAQKLSFKICLIYTSPILQSAGYKLKINFNENAKQMAFADSFTELNHNEIEAWLSQSQSVVEVLILQSCIEDKKMQTRIDLSEEILQKQGYSVSKVQSQGLNIIQNILFTILFGDFVSAYTAIIHNVDPTPVELIEEFKSKLKLSS